ncbi:helix-turn-helix domain-containing protein [Actinomadura keratinilytica]|uniref:helix-turn-helix domain-containing protein n=1 Tax=Actinomadura keratinilytica TaxID=547461 RepID=UPI00360E4663
MVPVRARRPRHPARPPGGPAHAGGAGRGRGDAPVPPHPGVPGRDGPAAARLPEPGARAARAAAARRGLRPAEVAARTGFADQAHLTRHFKRVVGVPPGAYQHARGVVPS